jgi:polyisoprenoid-binding protein YceI
MKVASFSLLAALISLPSFADWKLQADQSQVYFSTVKKESVAEVHQFKTLQGAISADGQFTLAVDLASAETGVAIRNERMAQYLFETTKFTQATGKGKIDVAELDKQDKGSSREVKVAVTFELHGKTITKEVNLLVVKLSAKQFDVHTPAPIHLNTADFDLGAGVEKLKELASLPSISPVVPVTLHLRFNQEGKDKKTTQSAPAMPANNSTSSY